MFTRAPILQSPGMANCDLRWRGKQSAQDLIRDLDLRPERVRTIYNCVDIESVRRRAAEEPAVPVQGPFLVYVGRLHPQKGVDVLLEAYARSRAREQYRLVLVGDGTQRSDLTALVGRLGIADRVTMTGFVENPWSHMARARAFLLPSLWEGFGLVTLEAMALSKPIIASRVGALPEIVADGESGWLVPPADPPALTAALNALLADPTQAKTMGAHGRVRLEKEFTVQRMARQHAAVYTEAASRVPEFRA